MDYETLLFPIHEHGNHWTLIAVSRKSCTLTYYDSLGGSNKKALEFATTLVDVQGVNNLLRQARPQVPSTGSLWAGMRVMGYRHSSGDSTAEQWVGLRCFCLQSTRLLGIFSWLIDITRMLNASVDGAL